ncbi:hypothetical protein ACTXT7_003076 [Hymenolepis weldensis]
MKVCPISQCMANKLTQISFLLSVYTLKNKEHEISNLSYRSSFNLLLKTQVVLAQYRRLPLCS